MSNNTNNSGNSVLKAYFAGAAILVALLTGVLIYTFIMGDPANFEGAGLNQKKSLKKDIQRTYWVSFTRVDSLYHY